MWQSKKCQIIFFNSYINSILTSMAFRLFSLKIEKQNKNKVKNKNRLKI